MDGPSLPQDYYQLSSDIGMWVGGNATPVPATTATATTSKGHPRSQKGR